MLQCSGKLQTDYNPAPPHSSQCRSLHGNIADIRASYTVRSSSVNLPSHLLDVALSKKLASSFQNPCPAATANLSALAFIFLNVAAFSNRPKLFLSYWKHVFKMKNAHQLDGEKPIFNSDQIGMPSSGVCVLIWRWCFCACNLPNTWASSGVLISSHGAFSEIFASTSGSPAINIATMPCAHAVPDFGGAETTISPARAVNAPQRNISTILPP